MMESLFQQVVLAASLPAVWELAEREIRRHPPGLQVTEVGALESGARPVVLFGTGRTARSALAHWQESGFRPAYCVDSNPQLWGRQFAGAPIHGPGHLLQDRQRPLVIVAAIMTHEIVQILDQAGLEHVFLEADGHIAPLPGHWLYRHRERVEEFHALCADEDSRRVLLELVKARLFQQFHSPLRGNHFTAAIATSPQYHPAELFSLGARERFVDCGAYDGDTLVDFAARVWQCGHQDWAAIAIEFDRANLAALRRTLATYGLRQVEIVPCGVGHEEGEVAADLLNNCLASAASGYIPMRTLDQIVAGFHPTYIKMDIEGWEMEALRGARATIAQERPRLAVCVYHQTSDLVEIPLYLHTIAPEHALYLRHHAAGSLCETVCYALPRQMHAGSPEDADHRA